MHSNPSKSMTEWLNLSEAARFLGVHFTTLRRWADQGKIAHIRTPGGRRRFSHADLQRFMRQSRQNPVKREIPPTPEPGLLADGNHLNIQPKLEKEDWSQKFGELERIKLKGSGQMMLGLLMQYTARLDNNEIYLSEARQIARNLGCLCAQAEMTISELVAAFLLFRSMIINMLLKTSAIQFSLDEEGRRLHERTNQYMDAMLLSIIEGYSDPGWIQ